MVRLSWIDGRTQMRTSTTRLFAVAAALIATGFGVWAASPSPRLFLSRTA
jgi:hypothetical protein